MASIDGAATVMLVDPTFPPSRELPSRRFADSLSPVDVAAIVVTHNNSGSVSLALNSLREEAGHARIRAILVDNDSSDGTLSLVRNEHKDVISMSGRGNLGYAGAINVACAYVGNADALLILNPDIEVHAGTVGAMIHRLRKSKAGIVVPKLLNPDGSLYPSLRHEPSLTRALGDALLGGRFQRRASAFSEMDFDAGSYVRPHEIDWATGAALLISKEVFRQLGPWDERYFLYSEETDYMRRTRDQGASIWFDPAAVMTHSQGGSGRSTALTSLSAVNRIRYVRKFHSPAYAGAFRSAVVLAEILRSRMPEHHGALRAVLDESTWGELPHGTKRAIHPTREPADGVRNTDVVGWR